MSENGPDTIDLADMGRSIARGWRLVLAGLAIGGLIAGAVLLFAPRRFDSYASAVVRNAPEATGSLLARMGDGAGAGAASALLGGGLTTPLETEIQVLGSRAVVGAAVDSLLLQVEPRSPDGLPATFFVRTARLPGLFKRYTLQFERRANGQVAVSGGNGFSAMTTIDGVLRVPTGVLVLAATAPQRFTLRIRDRDEAIKVTSSALNIGKAGGEVLRVAYRAPDSITAAAVPNAVLATYLARRKTSDRGVNAYRAEFLTGQLDSIAPRLASAEDALRRFQEQSGVLDPAVMGKLGLERAADLRKDAGLLDVEQGALDQLLSQIAAGRANARQLAAYPSFLKSPGINELLKQLAELETERTRLLERRLENDDEVQGLSRSIASLEGQLLPLGRAYAAALRRQRADVGGQLNTMASALATFPGATQTSLRLTREVTRLSQVYAVLQAQLVQARLSSIAEGGDVRSLDVATAPAKVSFPAPLLTSALGLGGGLLLGLLLALLASSHGRYLVDAYAIERAAGVPALRFDPTRPLLMSGRLNAKSVLLIPLDPVAGTAGVAERLADTAFVRGEQATVLDLTGTGLVTARGASVREMLARLEAEYALVIVRLPGLASDAAAAVLTESRPVILVAPPVRTNRGELVEAVDTLRRLDVPCIGIVVSEGESHAITAG